VTLRSNHQYAIVNDSEDDILVTIVAKLADTRGNNATESRVNLQVSANGSERAAVQAFFVANYDSPGTVTLIASTFITGGASASALNQCDFEVN